MVIVITNAPECVIRKDDIASILEEIALAHAITLEIVDANDKFAVNVFVQPLAFASVGVKLRLPPETARTKPLATDILVVKARLAPEIALSIPNFLFIEVPTDNEDDVLIFVFSPPAVPVP